MKIKTLISEKDLNRMREAVRSHTLTLTLQLSLVQTMQLSDASTQSSEILELLRQLKSDVASFHSTNTQGNVAGSSRSPGANETRSRSAQDPPTDSPLEEKISRLLELMGTKGSTVRSEDSEQMLQDLQSLLDSVRDVETTQSAAAARGRLPQCNHKILEENFRGVKLVMAIYFNLHR